MGHVRQKNSQEAVKQHALCFRQHATGVQLIEAVLRRQCAIEEAAAHHRPVPTARSAQALKRRVGGIGVARLHSHEACGGVLGPHQPWVAPLRGPAAKHGARRHNGVTRNMQVPWFSCM